MKLKCATCKTLLTKDLRPIKVKWNTQGYIFNKWQVFDLELSKYYDPEEEDCPIEYEYGNMKTGIFFITKKEYYNHKPIDSGISGLYQIIKHTPKIVVSGYDILEGFIPPNPKNCCCNWSYEPLYCTNCNSKLGYMHLDCYEYHSVRFDIDKVDRSYE